MSDAVTLTLRVPLDTAVEADAIAPDRFAELSERDIAMLPLWHGTRSIPLGELFDVRGGRSAQLRVAGDLTLTDGLGNRMSGGSLTIEGDVGGRVAAEMSGGAVDILGSVGDDAGSAMSGGTLRVRGDAGDRLGGPLPGASKGMMGGEIVVAGCAGTEAAARVRRGLVAVAGDVGDRSARAMIAGTLVVLGRTGRNAGRGSKRGSIVAVGDITVPVTYRYSCTYRPPHVRFLMTYLRNRHGLGIDDRVVSGNYRRHCGDAGDPGRGEILQWASQ
jgi:formylmethanofuran dehydrogenase subunit C